MLHLSPRLLQDEVGQLLHLSFDLVAFNITKELNQPSVLSDDGLQSVSNHGVPYYPHLVDLTLNHISFLEHRTQNN